MPREFVLYSDNHALQYIMQQPKLNLKHVKRVEFLQRFTFVLKRISVQLNRVADDLSRILLIMQENQIQVLGFEHLRDFYAIVQAMKHWRHYLMPIEFLLIQITMHYSTLCNNLS